MRDVKRHHQKYCPKYQPILDLSLDGIQECKSSSLSADVYSVSFKHCNTVYPIRIIRPINKFKVDDQLNIKEVIEDIHDANCILENVVGDNPKRSNFRCALCSSAAYACEYCESKAEYVTDNGKKKGHLAWPHSSTANGPPRTIEKFLLITENIKSGNAVTRDECKGFYGTSHLLHIENFHFVDNIPAEYMHSGCLGVVKRITHLTFNTGDNRERTTVRKLSDLSTFNVQIISIQVVREFNRRIRNLDLGVWKAQEYRNLIMFYFPIVINCIQDGFTKEKKVWLYLAYVLRACSITNNEFQQIPVQVIENAILIFYKCYESVYGKKNCTYSIHLMSHILKIRGDVPLTEKSAFKYENFYAELRQLFQPGTISPSKQILENCYMKRQLQKHSCEKKIFYDTNKNGKENNSFIYYIENNEYKFFNIIKKINDTKFVCNPQGRFPYKCDITKNLNWDKVGVFRVAPFSNEEIEIDRKQIEGKVLRVDNLFITCPINILNEQ